MTQNSQPNLSPEGESTANSAALGTCSGGLTERSPEPFCSDGEPFGFFDVEAAHDMMLRRRAPKRQLPKQTWRDCSRICLPGMLLSRAVGVAMYPLVMAGPELAKRLEPRIELLDDISDPSWSQNVLRSAIHWLLRAPNSAPGTTEEKLDSEPFSPEFARVALALEKEMSGPSLGGVPSRPTGQTNAVPVRPSSPRDTLPHTDRGVR